MPMGPRPPETYHPCSWAAAERAHIMRTERTKASMRIFIGGCAPCKPKGSGLALTALGRKRLWREWLDGKVWATVAMRPQQLCVRTVTDISCPEIGQADQGIMYQRTPITAPSVTTSLTVLGLRAGLGEL